MKWVIEGAHKYYTSGMKIPECVKAKNEEYKTIQDTFNLFLENDIIKEVDPEYKINNYVNASTVYQRYIERCNVEQIPKTARLSNKVFGMKLKEIFENKHSNGIKYKLCLTENKENNLSLLSY